MRSLLAVACAAGLLCASHASANVTIVLHSGARIEATTAYEMPHGVHATLPGGGVIVLPLTAVKRVSHLASDLPDAPRMAVTSKSNGGYAALTASADDGGTWVSKPAAGESSGSVLPAPRIAASFIAPAGEEAPRGVRPSPSDAAARRQAQRSAAANPLTGGFQRYSRGMASQAIAGPRDPALTGSASLRRVGPRG